MNRRIFALAAASALAATGAWAQGPRGPGNAAGPQTGLNMAAQSTVQGAITSVQIAAGTQYPSIVVNNLQIKAAPVWFLLENDFELVPGEIVSVIAAPSNNTADAYLSAIRITKQASGESLVLRDELGRPLWTSAMEGRGGGPLGPADCGACVDLSAALTVTGIIDRVNAGAGIRQPALVLKLADATLLTVKLGSERLILANDFELNPGATLTVTYAPAPCTGELVALGLTNSAGVTLTLRR